MIGKGKSISHGVAALEYDLAKEINGQAVATEIARHELYGCTGAEMVQEMKPYGKSSVSCPLKPSDSAPLKHSTMPP